MGGSVEPNQSGASDAAETRSWLGRIGFEAYAEAFEHNHIDLALAAKLTEDDLKELGVASLGHRKRLLEAIAVLRSARAEPEPSPETAGRPLRETPGAVRRLLTVMFCDLVESTGLSTRLDPEDYREVIRAYQDACAGVIARYDGFVARFLGDGVLAYFGWPVGHEDDAERAVRAGLRIVDAVAELPPLANQARLRVRVGLATGPTIVGDIIGEGASQEAAATGLTPNLAARLQQVAPPSGVVISAATRELVRDLFQYEDLGPQILKGIDRPVDAWRVTGVGTSGSRFAAVRGRTLVPIVGRDGELALLGEHWHAARGGEGRVVLIVGEAGIGKSRLVEALAQGVAADAALVLRLQCSPYESTSALSPVMRHFERVPGLAPTLAPEARLQALTRLLDGVAGLEPLDLALVANLLMLPPATALLQFSPEQLKQRTLEALGRYALPPRTATLLILEDAHWIDPTTLELLELLASRAAERPALVVVTQRPEWAAPMVGLQHVHQLHLGRLSRQQVAEMVRSVAGQDIPENVLETIVGRADGIPLFAEEVTRVVLDSASNGEIASVPDTLQALLLARLDRLPAATKDLAQLAAAIGREVPLPLLLSVAGLQPDELDRELQPLLQSRLLLHGDKGQVVFRHALIRDAAYQSMLGRQRRAIHRRVATALESSFAQTAGAQPELVARHFAEAGEPRTAIGYWRQAGERATALLASREAVDHYGNALGQLALLPADAERDREELQLTLAMGVPLIAATGYGSDPVRRAYGRARELAQQLGDTDCLFAATRGLWNCIYDQAELEFARQLAEDLTRLAGSDRKKQALAFRALGSTQMSLLAYAEALSAFDRCIAARVPDAQPMATGDQAEAPWIVALQYKGLIRCLQGRPDEGLAFHAEAIAQARSLRQPLTLAFSLHVQSAAAMLCREHAIALAAAEETLELATEHGLVFWIAGSKITRGCANAQLRRSAEGLEMALEGLAEWRATSAKLYVPTWSALIADAAIRLDRLDTAAVLVADATAVAEANGDFMSLADLQRLDGDMALRRGERERGRAALERAIATAGAQGAALFAVQAAARLGASLLEDGRGEEARRVLQVAAASLPAAVRFPALDDVRRLLESLGG